MWQGGPQNPKRIWPPSGPRPNQEERSLEVVRREEAGLVVLGGRILHAGLQASPTSTTLGP